MEAILRPRAAEADSTVTLYTPQLPLSTHGFDGVERMPVCIRPLCELWLRRVIWVHGYHHVAVCTYRDVLEDVHVVRQAHACWLVGDGMGVDEVVPAAPGLAACWHEAEIRMEVADVFGCLEGCEDRPFLR